MPELAEVERARLDCEAATKGKIVKDVITREDTIVYLNCTHDELARSVKGKQVQRVGRLGKYFYIIMATAPHILCHLGMAGFVATEGKEPLFYRKKAKNWANDDGSTWPLRYHKFAFTMEDGTRWCFCDSRRLGRIRLIDPGEGKDITEVEPLSKSGRDPYLDMPTLEELSIPVLKRKAPIKAVLLDQHGPLCGLGNWLVDEILFQAAIHPAQRANTLSATQLLAMHTQIRAIVTTAVSVNADHSLFPANWLFHYRWGKGRRHKPATFILPDGREATVTHQTVGGRTSAIVDIVQQIQGEVASDSEDGASSADQEEGEEELEAETPKKRYRKKEDITPASSAGRTTPAKRARKAKTTPKAQVQDDSDLTAVSSEEDKIPVKKTSRKRSGKPAKAAQIAKEEIASDDAHVKAEEDGEGSPTVKKARTKAVKTTRNKAGAATDAIGDGAFKPEGSEDEYQPVKSRQTKI